MYHMKIKQNETADSPRSSFYGDNYTTIFVPSTSRYFTNECKVADTFQEFEQWKEENKEEILICLPLYAYIHGGATVFLKKEDCTCRFDSGQIGYIYITKESYKKMMGEDQSKNTPEKLLKIAESEVKIFDEYLRGNVFGYIIEKEVVLGIWVYEASCWGFYGEDNAKEAGEEALKSFQEEEEKDGLKWVIL
jgi:hypothetical protein